MPESPVVPYAQPDVEPIRLRNVWIMIALLLAGAALLFVSRQYKEFHPFEFVFGPLGLCVGLLPASRRRIWQFSNWLDNLKPRQHALLVAILAVLLPIHMMAMTVVGQRVLVPMMHDEQMYLLQARQMASFHLAMPPHPLGEFFDTFYVFVKPVYASMYFPGTALAYVPSIWLNLPFYAWPVLIMTGLCLMTYLVSAQVLGRLAGLLGLLIVLATGPMNWMPTATLSHPLGGFFGLTVIYAWLRWRVSRKIGWAALLGTAAGWMAITRPLESLAFCLPIVVAIALSIRRPTLKVTLVHAMIAFACTTPFLALQLALNHTVTGSWTKLPITLYVEQEFPGMNSLGFSPDNVKSTSTLPAKQAMFKQFVAPVVMKKTGMAPHTIRERFVYILGSSLFSPLAVALLPLSWWLLRRPGVAILWAILLAFTVAYSAYVGYFSQYSSQVMAILAVLVVSGMVALADAFPRFQRVITSSYTLTLVGVSLTVLCLMPHNGEGGGGLNWKVMQFNYQTLPKVVQKPALVMITFGEKSSPFVEPVYNLEAAWPDDARVIRAHDFGPQRNLDLYRYYAKIQPDRNVYLYDRENGVLKSLGRVGDLVRQADADAATTRPAAANRP